MGIANILEEYNINGLIIHISIDSSGIDSSGIDSNEINFIKINFNGIDFVVINSYKEPDDFINFITNTNKTNIFKSNEELTCI